MLHPSDEFAASLLKELTDYENIRLVRNDKMWRYFGVVHEYIAKTTREQADEMYQKAIERNPVLRQCPHV